MYEELVRALRNNAEHYMTVKGEAGLVHVLTEAADAIEELSREVEDYETRLELTPEAQYAIDQHADDLIDRMDKLIEGLDEKPRWISVEERLPECQGPFLTRYGFGDASRETGQYFFGVRYYLYADAEPHWQDESMGLEVTHWMPLPSMEGLK